MGRLIFPKLVTVALLDTEASESSGRMDDVYRTIRRKDTTGDGIGDAGRAESTIQFLAQLEAGDDEDQRMTPAGDVPDSDVQLATYLGVMRLAGHVTAARPFGVKKGDRLVAAHDRTGGTLLRAYPGNLYCVRAQPIDSRRQDLLLFRFEERPQGVV